jgi:hypothetical protein
MHVTMVAPSYNKKYYFFMRLRMTQGLPALKDIVLPVLHIQKVLSGPFLCAVPVLLCSSHILDISGITATASAT